MLETLVNSYRYWRTGDKRRAHIALEHARDDAAKYAAALADGDTARAARYVRYPGGELSKVYRAKDEDGVGHVENPENVGLRFVGRVIPEMRRYEIWDRTGDTGWHTDPYGDVFKDGTGLCYGMVYQLPGRNGMARFVAGYEFGGTDGGPTVHYGRIFEEPARPYGYSTPAKDFTAAHDAARAADDLAKDAAETEREYQTAWQAGNRYGEIADKIAETRKETLALLAEMRQHKRPAASAPAAICAALRATISDNLSAIKRRRAKMKALRDGEFTGLEFYPRDPVLVSAFNESAGL